MKILAIEKEMPGVDWNSLGEVLKNEAKHVFELYLSDTLREIYFTEHKNAVLVLECADIRAAKNILDTLPLVASGKITFDLMELRPYSGLERIISR